MERIKDGQRIRILPLSVDLSNIPKRRNFKPKVEAIGRPVLSNESAVDESDDDLEPHRRLRYNSSHDTLNEFAPAHVYYGDEHDLGSTAKGQARSKYRTMSFSVAPRQILDLEGKPKVAPKRRMSHDEFSSVGKRFIINVDHVMKQLLHGEDTDQNFQITIFDQGPKSLSLGTANSAGYKRADIRGAYALANLLQELTFAKDFGRLTVVLDEGRIYENAVSRLNRLIKEAFWPGLTRRIDGDLIEIVANDPKDRTPKELRVRRVYVPIGAPEQLAYYKQIALERPNLKLEVHSLPKEITPEYVKSLNDSPGILALDMHWVMDDKSGKMEYQGKPFVVPGGRFNELYGWDSYMESLGLIIDDRVDLAKSMVENFIFCINHYGKILNANRSYYLSRSQPPFLTDMALRVYDKIKHEGDSAKEFLRRAILAAIKEYHTVWMAAPRLDLKSGLSRYRPDGLGIPPETEPSHFTHLLEPYAEKHGITIEEFTIAYNDGTLKEPALDDYFLHDRAVRESGHDTSYRLERVCANLATIDLNSLLYKYETDIARTIRTIFNDKFTIPAEWCVPGQEPDHKETSAVWDRRSRKRKSLMDKYLWNKQKGMYFDYDTVLEVQTDYESATTFWAMWAGVASPSQASELVGKALPKFEVLGGLVAGTEESRGEVGLDRPNRQWDFPFGWAPQQMLAWAGFTRYGFTDEAERLAYRWLYMMTKSFIDFNGVVVEKYDVTQPVDPHRVDAEYGNQGSDFKGAPREGFGWVNASYQVGLQIINSHMRRALGACTPPEVLFPTRSADSLDDDFEDGIVF